MKKSFKLFLVIYLIVLLYHASHLAFDSWIPIVVFSTALLLALFAHFRAGYSTILLLGIHMGIEWHGHVTHGILSYSANELVLYGLHAALDTILLTHELREHFPKRAYLILSIIGSGLILLLIHAGVNPSTNVHMHDSFLEYLVLGGITGCTIFHLFKNKRIQPTG
jgi:hypothetical protein